MQYDMGIVLVVWCNDDTGSPDWQLVNLMERDRVLPAALPAVIVRFRGPISMTAFHW